MKRSRILGLVALAMLALSALGATAAQAKPGPHWWICEPKAGGAFMDSKCSKTGEKLFEKVELGAKKTKAIEAKLQTATIVLKSTVVTITCTALKLEAGAVIEGLGATSSGTSHEIVKFENCTQKGNNEKEPTEVEECKVAESKTIKTEKILNTLDYPKKEPAVGDTLLVLFKPEASEVFVKVKFEGKCKLIAIAVEGSVAGEAWNSAKEPVKLHTASETLGEVAYVNFPEPAIKEDCVEVEGNVTCKAVGLTAATKPATLTGTAQVKLVSKEDLGVFGK